MPPEMKLLLRDLPAPVADPLHILPPFLPLILGLSLVALLVSIGVWLLAYYYATKKQQVTGAPRRREPVADAAGGIRQIRQVYGKNGEFREGCHALSRLLKEHFESKTGLPVEEMTAFEIAASLRGPPVDFFRELSALQFARSEPGKGDFERACNLSESVRKSKFKVLRGIHR